MISRKSAFSLTATEQTNYIDGVTAMITAGEYVKFVNIHLDMSHQMHTMRGMGGMVGTRRFLPWHRDYLLQMEKKLRTFKANAFVPYWDWTAGGVPPWLVSFTPTITGVVDPQGVNPSTIVNARTSTSPVSNPARIAALLAMTDYDTFTRQLELDPHNSGHNALGFPMTSLASPCDPIFWMHHSMVDRVWSLWQKANPGRAAILTGKDAQMDPWMTKDDTVSGLDSIKKLGYEYI